MYNEQFKKDNNKANLDFVWLKHVNITIWPKVVNFNLLNSVARINCDPQLKGNLLLMSYDSHHLVVL